MERTSQSTTSAETVPVYRPRLPPAQALVPYLEQLDRERVYSNFGPLSAALTQRLACAMNINVSLIALASSGSAALVAAILSTAGRATADRPICLLPAYTFCATALAAQMCGYRLHFLDVEADTWAVDPRVLTQHYLLNQTGLIVPVQPYGRAGVKELTTIRNLIDVPIVVDAAASIEAFFRTTPPQIPGISFAVSLHATKSFSTGEGGLVISPDVGSNQGVYRALNFGMLGDRSCRSPGFNGKISEYHAAVGLAELDAWDTKVKDLSEAASLYKSAAAARGLAHQIISAPETASCYVLFKARDKDEGERVTRALNSRNFDTRFWYGFGLKGDPLFECVSSDELTVTEQTSPLIVGLPTAPDLKPAHITELMDIIKAAVGD